ncbi:MAG TPA: amidohydrolase family protein [Pseudolabrys sp.]|nr:amidohydrolase family protein [Pseudolabrys sp.]
MIVDMRLRPPTKSWIDKPQFKKGVPFYPSRVGFPRPPSAEQRSMKLMLEEMDTAGITWGVAMGRHSAEPLGAVPNDEIREVVDAHPKRFVSFAGIDISQSPDAMLAELNRCLAWRGFIGPSIEPGASRPPLKTNDRKLYPLYEACQSRNVPISISLSNLLCVMTNNPVEYSSPLPLYDVARDFPKLDIILSHAAWPWIYETIGLAFACHNIYVSPDLYMVGMNMPGAQEYINAANSFLSDRILFGTAYPSRPLIESVEAFDQWRFEPGVKEKVLGKNALRVMRMEG